MLDGGIIQRLLEEKWKTFAQNQFLKRLLILSTHLLCLSCSVYLRPAHDGDDEEAGGDQGDAPATAALKDAQTELAGNDDGDDYNAQTVARYCAELATIAGVLSYVVFQQGDEIKNQGLSAFLKQLVSVFDITNHPTIHSFDFFDSPMHRPRQSFYFPIC